ncbi:tRNA (guanosine(37)-N1)-methyltransferase TrmD [Kiritimatiellaeota bacterium B1221]|nr:tRNA (guanosine(37)-N1)-methyltransferase TrmD [Kiritimatiellaeota bacterium B1221]
MRIDVITLFPDMLKGFLEQSMMKRATESGAVEFGFTNPRDFTTDIHRTTDDRAYGGGPGMVMKPEPLFSAIESLRKADSRVIYLSPQGPAFTQAKAENLCKTSHLIFLCGHYEGVDERVLEALVDEEISIGDYVLTNGALAAAVVIDATVRLIPGVLGGGEAATAQESFSSGILDHPHYTRPEDFRGMKVPSVLLSGNHAAINAWRREQAEKKTRAVRPDLM